MCKSQSNVQAHRKHELKDPFNDNEYLVPSANVAPSMIHCKVCSISKL